MQFSSFGQKFTQNSGILQLMDDLGNALNSNQPINMLGGGNPARIDEVNQAYREVLGNLVNQDHADVAIENIANYSNPQGDSKFIQALVEFFNRHYHWNLTSENIALTNGSQNAFFYLFNLFAGEFSNGKKKSILLPLAPEYIGYADVQIAGSNFVAIPPIIEQTDYQNKQGFFKYRVDFDTLEKLPSLQNGEIGAICCSRPTNPTGNVLTDDEMVRLDNLAKKYQIPLIVDNAYGMPFPNIIHQTATLTWHDNMILCFSLSKVGLPSVRTGIVVACPQIIQAISSLNAILNLAPTRFGATLATPLIENGKIEQLSKNVIQPFYQQQVDFAVNFIQQQFVNYPVKIHQPEGAIFLWLWFEHLPITTMQLYQMLKEKGVIIIPSEHFFVGLDTTNYRHAHECIRVSIAQSQEILQQGLTIIAETVKQLYDN